MSTIKRIAIIGNAGSGKSTLALVLQEIFALPVYHMDQYFWKPNWVHPDIDEYKVVHDAICDHDEWIIDGMNLRLLDYRAARAQVIIFLDYPRYLCFWRIFKRVFKYYGQETPSSAKGCAERFNRKFFAFLKWVWDFKKKYPKAIHEVLKAHKNKKVYIVRSPKEISLVVKALRTQIG